MKTKNTLNYIIAALFIILLIATAYVLLNDEEKPENKRESFVIGYELSKKEIFNKVEALGNANANESINITSNATETIKEIKFEDGQIVEAGDVLVLLDQQAERARLQAAQARLKEDEIELKRVKTLLNKKAATKREYDERKTLVEVTRQEIKEFESQVEERTLTAPFSGVVGIRRLSVGALVQPGTLITTLDDVSVIKLDFTVPAVNLSKLKIGLPVYAESEALGDNVYKGKVASINSRIDPVSRSILVRAIIENNDNLIKPGMLMKVTLLENKRQAIVIPEESIIQKGSDHFVFVVKDDTAHETKITIGKREFGTVEVVNGLKAGEIIVVRGMGEIRDQQKVKIKDLWKEIKGSQFENNELEDNQGAE